jgi:hypothetical protein
MGVMVSPALQVHLDHQEHASNVPVAVEPKHQLTLQEVRDIKETVNMVKLL